MKISIFSMKILMIFFLIFLMIQKFSYSSDNVVQGGSGT